MDTIGDGSILIENILSSAEIGAAKQRAKSNAICMHRDAMECAVLSGALEHELSIRAEGRDCETCSLLMPEEALDLLRDAISEVMTQNKLFVSSFDREVSQDEFVKLVQAEFEDGAREMIA